MLTVSWCLFVFLCFVVLVVVCLFVSSFFFFFNYVSFIVSLGEIVRLAYIIFLFFTQLYVNELTAYKQKAC